MLQTICFILLYFFTLIIANRCLKLFLFTTPVESVVEDGNLAVVFCWSTYLLSVSYIFVSAVAGPSQGLINDLLAIAGYSLFGIAAMITSAKINDQWILHQFSTEEEIVNQQNMGTAFVQAGASVASALVIGASIYGEGGGVLSTLVFFVLAQAMLVSCARLYSQFIFPNLHERIEEDDNSIGLKFGGTLVALGIILSSSLRGGFSGWWEDISSFFISAIIGLILFPFIKAVFHSLLMQRLMHTLRTSVQDQANAQLGVAAIELSLMIGLALVLSALI